MGAEKPLDPRAALRDRTKIVGWGLALFAAVQALGMLLAKNHTGAVVAQLVLTEFGTGRLAIAWSDPLAPEPTTKAIATRAGLGAAIGASAAIVLLGASLALRRATIADVTFSISTLFVGTVITGFAAARDELLLRGLVLRALGPRASVGFRLAVGAAAGVAFRFGTDASATPWSLVVSGLLAVGFSALWIADRGAWLPWGANAAFSLVLGPLSQGAVLDVRATGAPLDAGPLAVAVAAAFAAFSVRRALTRDPRASSKDA